MTSTNIFGTRMGSEGGASTSGAGLFRRRSSEREVLSGGRSPTHNFGVYKPRAASLSDSQLQREAEEEWFPTPATIREHYRDQASLRAKKSLFRASLRRGRSPRRYENSTHSSSQEDSALMPPPPKRSRLHRNASQWAKPFSGRDPTQSLFGQSSTSGANHRARAASAPATVLKPSKLNAIHGVIASATKRTKASVRKEKAYWDERIEKVLNLRTTLTRIEGLGCTLRLLAGVIEGLHSTIENIGEEVDATISTSLALSKLPLKEKRRLLESLLSNSSYTQDESNSESDDDEPELVADLGHLPVGDSRRSATNHGYSPKNRENPEKEGEEQNPIPPPPDFIPLL